MRTRSYSAPITPCPLMAHFGWAGNVKGKPMSTTSVKNLPVSLFGAVMGLAGLSLAWRVASGVFGSTQ